ncbi:LysR family transcriptional regulator [bacterium M00.F.Ca.ET.194.01.1.1]|uniref:LysR family transcriptional regulator n=1 Tax=Agrobacterium pusense TaxID=648995 RepID=UPI001092AC27|nr:LysR family transcriptional regulator [Agrobacterium pusense]TGR71796.1 LysR family transcriptional regulator [bacterium M00.F.Ca.ET.194.01.1.1]TGS56698.1 LysR family transcriptional regulator [bacterium M00.F.Ca.ET.179.01.1.1]TGV49630.1 LysR family transcriptional regulator [bacterium M00.F.Ca.ET.168.01.1.1]
MQRFSLGSIDLNLLKVIYALVVKGNMTAAGEYIGLSQPAMSHALKRARAITGDELFRKTSGGFVMTRFCAEIFPAVRRIIEDTETVMLSHLKFEPETSHRAFRIGMNDYFSVVLMPRLIERVQARAKHCVLEVIHMPRTGVANNRNFLPVVQEHLDEGTIDVAVMTADNFPARYRCTSLFRERRVCIMSATNPAAQKPLTLDALLSLGHVKVTSAPSRRGWIDERLDAMGLERRVVAVVPHFSAAVAIIARSDLVAIMPESVAKLFERSHELLLLESPFAEEKQSTSMIWLAEKERDPASQWLREQISDCFIGDAP